MPLKLAALHIAKSSTTSEMRILRSESSCPPPFDALLPMEKSWALEVEKDDETFLLCSNHKALCREHSRFCSTDGKESSWDTLQWTNRGSREVYRERETKANGKVSRSSDLSSCKTLPARSASSIDTYDDPWRQGRSTGKQSRSQAFTPSSQFNISQAHCRSSDFFRADKKSEKARSPPHSYRSHHGHNQGDLHETTSYIDSARSELADRILHTSSSRNHFSWPGGAGHAWSSQADRQRHEYSRGAQALQPSDDTDGASHGCPRRTQDVRLLANTDNSSCDITRGGASAMKPPGSANSARHRYSRKVERKSGHESLRNYREHAGNEFENEGIQGSINYKLDARRSCYDKHCHKEHEGHIHIPAGSGDSYRYRKKERNWDHVNESSDETCKGSHPQSEIEARFESENSKEVSALQMQQIPEEKSKNEEPATTLLQAGDKRSSTLEEGLGDKVQNRFISSERVMEINCNDDVEVKEDDPLDTKKQYEMLASLLLDDSLDIDQDFDVTLAPGFLDSEYYGSIFGDDFELPSSMDVEAVVEGNSAMFAEAEAVIGASQPVYLEESNLSALHSLQKDGKGMRKQQPVFSDKLAGKHSDGDQPAGKLQCLQVSSRAKPSPRVFVDVTNKFEIHAAPAVKVETQEDDAHRLSQRQRQVEFGKNTLGYERYSELVPRHKRKSGDPQTPNPKQICSKRSWDGQIRKWRRLLHAYDPPNEDGEERAEDFSALISRHGCAADSVKEDARFLKLNENKDHNAGGVKVTEEDAYLTIYDDWVGF